MRNALCICLVVVSLGGLAAGRATPANAQNSDQSLQDYLAGEKQRICELAKAPDSQATDIDAARQEIDRMLRVATGEVQFLELTKTWWTAEIMLALSNAYQDLRGDDIDFGDSMKLGAATSALSLVLSNQQVPYERLYQNLQSDDPSQVEIDEAGGMVDLVGGPTQALGGVLLTTMKIPLSVVEKGEAAVIDALIDAAGLAVAGKVLETQAVNIALVVDAAEDQAVAKAALKAVKSFHTRSMACLDAWQPATEQPQANSACVPKGTLFFHHPEAHCDSETYRMKVKIVTGDGDVVEYVDGCARASYSKGDNEQISLQLGIWLDGVQFSGTHLGMDPDGSFEGRFSVYQRDLGSNFSVGVAGQIVCGGGGLPAAISFDCFPPDQSWAGEFYEGFGQGAQVSCAQSIPYDEIPSRIDE